MPHWHAVNPWADRAVYISLEEAASLCAGGSIRLQSTGETVPMDEAFVLDHFERAGDQLDAYLLQGGGELSLGVRFGPEPSDYLSPRIKDHAAARELLERGPTDDGPSPSR